MWNEEGRDKYAQGKKCHNVEGRGKGQITQGKKCHIMQMYCNIMLLKEWFMNLMMMTNKVIYSSYFFFPIDLVVDAQLAIRCKLKNCPSDSIDINCHGGS